MSLEEKKNSQENYDWYITDEKFQKYWLWHGLFNSKETLKNSPNFIVNRKQIAYLQRQIVISYFKNFFLFPLYVLKLLSPWYLKGKNDVGKNLKNIVKNKEFKPLRFAVLSQTILIIIFVLLGFFILFRYPDTSNATALFANAVDYTTGTNPYSVVAADFDGDGNSDLAVTNQGANTVSVFINNGDGTFAIKVDYGTGTTPTMVQAEDLNGDTYEDLALVNEGGNLSVLMNNGDGTFATKVDYVAGTTPYAVAISDLNGDTYKDIAVANENTNNISIFINNGDGTFAGSQSYGADSGPYSIALGDINGDTYPDVVAANQLSTTISVLLNNGDGTFAKSTNYTAGANPYSVVMDNFDNDAYLDLAVSTGDNTVAIFINDGTGLFPSRVDYGVAAIPYHLGADDLDNDGDKDLTIGYFGQSYIATLLNNGDGTFALAVDYPTGGDAVSVAISDLDNDGDKDLAVANYSSTTLSILLNQTIPPNAAPTVGPLTVASSTDGSGNISISTTVDDSNLNDLNISYYYDTSTTTCALTATTTISNSISSSFGSPVVNNANSTGQVTGVITDAGANTVGAIWNSKIDLPDANGDYCIIVYAYDGAVTSTVATTTVTLDNTSPPTQDFTSFTLASSSISLAWDSPADPNDLGSFTVSSTVGSSVNTTSTSYTYEPLTPNTLYYFQLKLSDDYGNNNGFSAVTSTYTNSAIPLNLSATAMDSETIALSWDANNNPVGTVYKIYNATSRTYPGTTTSTSYNVTGLTAETSYSFRVSAQYFSNSATYSFDSNTASATTLAPSAPTTPSVSDFSNFSSSAFDVSWGATDNTAYYIVSSTASVETATTSATSYSLSDLSPNTLYSVQVKAHDGGSQTSDYSVVTSTYSNSAVPLSVSGSANGQTSIILSWATNNNPTGTVYEVYNVSNDTVVGTTTDTTYYVKNLLADTSYQFKVRSQYLRDSSLYSSYSVSSQPVNTSRISSMITLNLKVAEDPTSFAFPGGNSHTAQLSNITSGAGKIVFHSNTVEVTLSAGQSQNIDLSGNGHNDTNVIMNYVGADLANLSLIALSQGGGAITNVVPKVSSEATKAVVINNGDTSTNIRKVELKFNVTGAELMAISNDVDFSQISFESYGLSKLWTLSEGNGLKTVFVKFRSKEGGTIVYSDTIELTGQSFFDPNALVDVLNDSSSIKCNLITRKPYKSKTSNGVYYITDNCTKRAFKNPNIYFSHFASWSEVLITSDKILESISNDIVGFMNFGNRLFLKEKTLVKSSNNPKVYLIQDEQKRWIKDEETFLKLKYNWSDILEVDSYVLDKYPDGNIL